MPSDIDTCKHLPITHCRHLRLGARVIISIVSTSTSSSSSLSCSAGAGRWASCRRRHRSPLRLFKDLRHFSTRLFHRCAPSLSLFLRVRAAPIECPIPKAESQCVCNSLSLSLSPYSCSAVSYTIQLYHTDDRRSEAPAALRSLIDTVLQATVAMQLG